MKQILLILRWFAAVGLWILAGQLIARGLFYWFGGLDSWANSSHSGFKYAIVLIAAGLIMFFLGWFVVRKKREETTSPDALGTPDKCRIDIPGRGPIEFEGITLPQSVKHLEAACFYSSLSEDVGEWILDLHYAWGRQRQASRKLVLKACAEIESRIHSERKNLEARLGEVFEDADPAEICQEWLTAIQTMRQCAEKSDVCTWTIKPMGREIAIHLDSMIKLAQHAGKVQGSTILSPEFIKYIETAPEDEQLGFVTMMTDRLSS
jgi:hypothetical protein